MEISYIPIVQTKKMNGYSCMDPMLNFSFLTTKMMARRDPYAKKAAGRIQLFRRVKLGEYEN